MSTSEPGSSTLDLLVFLLLLGGGVWYWQEYMSFSRRTRCGGISALQSNMRGIATSMIAYSQDFEGRYPSDLNTLMVWSEGDVTPKLFIDPAHRSIAEPILYVRPTPAVKSITPVLISDPACREGRGSLVVYGDAHTEFVKGRALWDQAKRLAALPKARAGGIEPGDWITPP